MKPVLMIFLMVSLTTVVALANPNRVSVGSHPNGRMWFNNLELDSRGEVLCMSGINSVGVVYNSCESPGSLPDGAQITVTVSDGILTLSGFSGSVRVTVHSTAKDSNMVFDFGVVTSGATVSTRAIGKGSFTVVTHRSNSLGDVTDADIVVL